MGLKAVHECDTDLNFGGLAVWVSRGDALAEGLEAAHLGFGVASGVVSRPPFPARSALVTRGAQVRLDFPEAVVRARVDRAVSNGSFAARQLDVSHAALASTNY